MHFAMGCYQAFRNPANYRTGDWNPRLAFQHLVAFNITLGRAATWRVDKWYPPIDQQVLTGRSSMIVTKASSNLVARPKT